MKKAFLFNEIDYNNSRYGKPSATIIWCWENDTQFGSVIAITEMEAIDRIRERFDEVETIRWTKYKNFVNNLAITLACSETKL